MFWIFAAAGTSVAQDTKSDEIPDARENPHHMSLDDPADATFLKAGWVKQGEVRVPATGGTEISAVKYQKRIGERDIHAIHIPDRNTISFGRGKHQIFLKGRMISIAYRWFSMIAIEDDNITATDGELKSVLEQAENRWSEDVAKLTKIRHFKGVFGLSTMNTEPYIGLVRENRALLKMMQVRFKGANIELLMSDGEGKVTHTIEVDPDFGYVSSSVNGMAIPAEMVETGPLIGFDEFREQQLKELGIKE